MSLFMSRSTHAGARNRGGMLAVATIAAAAALLAGCSSSTDDDESSTSPSVAASAESTADASTVMVIDQTNLLLVTAQQTLEARGLVVEVTDVTGQGRAIEDPAAWVVVTQTPSSGEVDAGSTVTIEARLATDPIS